MLTVTKIKNLKPKNKRATYNDTGGLSLMVMPNRSKLWRFRYSWNGKQKLLSLGAFPDVSLVDARVRRDECKKMVAKDIDPSLARQQGKQEKRTAYTVEKLLRQWCEYHYSDKSNSTSQHTLRRFELYLFPWLGKALVKDITSPMVLDCLRRVEKTQKYETAKRLKMTIGQALRYGVGEGICERDVTQDLTGLLKAGKVNHMPTLTVPKEISKLLRDIDSYKGSFVVKCALQMSAYVFVRPKEVSLMQWQDIDFEKSEWLIPAEIMKMREPHIVPLSKQALVVLEEIKPLTASSSYVFTGHKNHHKPMNSQTVNMALIRMGYKDKMVAHGFKGMASTLLNENGFKWDVVERQLAHKESNAVRGAYNHAQYMPERIEMMQWWGDYLEQLKHQCITFN